MSARTLYRAVSLAEAEEIRNTGRFRCVPGAMETKLFATAEADAGRFARDVLFRIDRAPLFIAFVELPDDLYGALLRGVFAADFQLPTVGIGPSDLALVNLVGRVGLLSFCPIPF